MIVAVIGLVALEAYFQTFLHRRSGLTKFLIVFFLPIGFRAIVQRTESLRMSGQEFRRIVEDLPLLVCLVEGSKSIYANAEARKVLQVQTSTETDADPHGTHSARCLSELCGAQNSDAQEVHLRGVGAAAVFVDLRTRQVFFEGRWVTELLGRDVSAERSARILAAAEHAQRTAAEHELAVARERQRIYVDIHDHLGARLTDLLLEAGNSGRGDPRPELCQRIADTIDVMRERLLALQDHELMAHDFSTGLNLLLLRRYTRAERTLHFQTEPGAAVALEALEGGRKTDLASLCLENATNDLKYGRGDSEWKFHLEDGQLVLTMHSLVGHAKQNCPGLGRTGMAARARELGAELTTECCTDCFHLQVRIPMAHNGVSSEQGRCTAKIT